MPTFILNGKTMAKTSETRLKKMRWKSLNVSLENRSPNFE